MTSLQMIPWTRSACVLAIMLMISIDFGDGAALEQDKEDDQAAPATSANCISADPVPVILFSKGRSGSTTTWATIAALMGGGSRAIEFTGSNARSQIRFFRKHTTGSWVHIMLCRLQGKFRQGIVGTKWKPFLDLTSEAEVRALEVVRDHPEIKVLQLTRNPLDWIISRHKHSDDSSAEDLAPPHCGKNNADCLQLHLKLGQGMTLPTENLVERLQNATRMDIAVNKALHLMGVDHLEVTYEELYSSESASAWQRILAFLGRPAPELTMADVRQKFKTAPTAHKHHNVSLANYEQVRATLSGTQFEGLLH